MAQDEVQSVTYDDFSGGWCGTLDLSKAAPNMFDARNMLLYRDGFIGPRPGLKEFNLGRTLTSRPRMLQYMNDSNENGIWYADGLNVYCVSALNDGVNSQLVKTLDLVENDATVPWWSWRAIVSGGFFHVPTRTTGGTASGVHNIHSVSGSEDVFDMNGYASFGGTAYGVRYVSGKPDASTTQIGYTQPEDLFDWGTPANFINLVHHTGGNFNFVLYCTVQKNNLIIVDEAGVFYLLSGTPGINDSLRVISNAAVLPDPPGSRTFVDTGNDLVYFLAPNNNHPAYFDGTQIVDLSYLAMHPEDPYTAYNTGSRLNAHKNACGFRGVDDDSVGFVTIADDRLLMKHLGAWGLHQFTVDVSNIWTSDARGRVWGFQAYTGGAGTRLYSTDFRLNRPAFTSDTYATVGDNTNNVPVDAWIQFPDQWSEDGSQLRPTEIIIDFKKWNTGAPTTNHMKVQVEHRGMVSSSAASNVGNKTETKEWSEAGSEATTALAGEKDRWRVNVGEYAGTGFSIKVSEIRGVAIGSIKVNYKVVTGDARNW